HQDDRAHQQELGTRPKPEQRRRHRQVGREHVAHERDPAVPPEHRGRPAVRNDPADGARADEGEGMEWADGDIGSKVTMKYPGVWMTGEHARGETLAVAFAGEGQHQDTGAKMVHAAPNTHSSIVSKSVARSGGRAGYRGLVHVHPGAEGSS